MKTKRYSLLLCAWVYTALTVGSNTFAVNKESRSIDLVLHLVNTFSGTLTVTDILPERSGYVITSGTSLQVAFSATTDSTYSLSGSLETTVTGTGIGTYTQYETIPLPTGGMHTLTALFFHENEVVVAQPLLVLVDTVAPTIPVIHTPFLGQQINTSSLELSRSDSVDIETEQTTYSVVLSQTPTFSTAITYTNTDPRWTISSASLSSGVRFRYVVSTDRAGNISASSPSFFRIGDPGDSILRLGSMRRGLSFLTPVDTISPAPLPSRIASPTALHKNNAQGSKSSILPASPIQAQTSRGLPSLPVYTMYGEDLLLHMENAKKQMLVLQSKLGSTYISTPLNHLHTPLDEGIIDAADNERFLTALMNERQLTDQEYAMMLLLYGPKETHKEGLRALLSEQIRHGQLGFILCIRLRAYDIELMHRLRRELLQPEKSQPKIS